MARNDSRRTIPITKEEVDLFLETIVNADDRYSLRDEALFSVYAFTGLRRCEALLLTLGDVDVRWHTLFAARPKGGRSRLQPIPRRLSDVLNRYIALNFPGTHQPLWPLFPGRHPARALSAKQAWLRFDKWKRLAGIRKGLTIHSFRAGYATALYKATSDVWLVSRAVGHADIRTTEGYIEGDLSQIPAILESCFPLS